MTDMSQPCTMTPEQREEFDRVVFRREPVDAPPQWFQQSTEDELRERVTTLEARLARLSDDARAVLGDTTYGTLAAQHQLMVNVLDAVVRGTSKPSLSVLHGLALNTLAEVAPDVAAAHSGRSPE